MRQKNPSDEIAEVWLAKAALAESAPLAERRKFREDLRAAKEEWELANIGLLWSGPKPGQGGRKGHRQRPKTYKYGGY